MRKQRYQRYIAQSQDPARVNESTADLDMQFLDTQVKALKNIWADEEEEEIKKGDSYGAFDQDLKDLENKSINWTTSEAELTADELEARKGVFGGQSYVEQSQAHLSNPSIESPLKLVAEGDKVKLASMFKQELIEKYGEEEFNQNILYMNKYQPVIDKRARFLKLAESVPSKSYEPDYFSKRGVDPADDQYLGKQGAAQFNIEKLTQKAQDFISSTPLNDGNIGKVTAQLAERINAANLPDKQAMRLKQTLSTRITKFKDAKLKQFNLESEEIKTAYLTGKVPSIRDYSKLNNADAKNVGNAMFVKNSQALREGKISYSRFKQVPSGPRAMATYKTKVDAYVAAEYRLIKGVAASVSNEFLQRPVETIPVDQDLAVHLMHNYYDERRRENPDFTLDDAKDELYSSKSRQPIQQLIEYSHRDFLDLVKDKDEYIDLMRTTSGRMEFRRRAALANKPYASYGAKIEENDELTRSRSERPATN